MKKKNLFAGYVTEIDDIIKKLNIAKSYYQIAHDLNNMEKAHGYMREVYEQLTELMHKGK